MLENIFGNWVNAVIFLICVIGVLYLIAKFSRVNAIAKICFAIFVLIIYSELIVPLLINFLCGDAILTDELLTTFYIFIGSLNPPTGAYLLYTMESHFFPGFHAEFDLLFYIFGAILGGLTIAKAGKSLFRRDPPKEK